MKKGTPAKARMHVSGAVQKQSQNESTNGTWGNRQRIAMKAFEMYEQRGRLDGHDLDDWIKAEEIVNGTTK